MFYIGVLDSVFIPHILDIICHFFTYVPSMFLLFYFLPCIVATIIFAFL